MDRALDTSARDLGLKVLQAIDEGRVETPRIREARDRLLEVQVVRRLLPSEVSTCVRLNVALADAGFEPRESCQAALVFAQKLLERSRPGSENRAIGHSNLSIVLQRLADFETLAEKRHELLARAGSHVRKAIEILPVDCEEGASARLNYAGHLVKRVLTPLPSDPDGAPIQLTAEALATLKEVEISWDAASLAGAGARLNRLIILLYLTEKDDWAAKNEQLLTQASSLYKQLCTEYGPETLIGAKARSLGLSFDTRHRESPDSSIVRRSAESLAANPPESRDGAYTRYDLLTSIASLDAECCKAEDLVLAIEHLALSACYIREDVWLQERCQLETLKVLETFVLVVTSFFDEDSSNIAQTLSLVDRLLVAIERFRSDVDIVHTFDYLLMPYMERDHWARDLVGEAFRYSVGGMLREELDRLRRLSVFLLLLQECPEIENEAEAWIRSESLVGASFMQGIPDLIQQDVNLLSAFQRLTKLQERSTDTPLSFLRSFAETGSAYRTLFAQTQRRIEEIVPKATLPVAQDSAVLKAQLTAFSEGLVDPAYVTIAALSPNLICAFTVDLGGETPELSLTAAEVEPEWLDRCLSPAIDTNPKHYRCRHGYRSPFRATRAGYCQRLHEIVENLAKPLLGDLATGDRDLLITLDPRLCGLPLHRAMATSQIFRQIHIAYVPGIQWINSVATSPRRPRRGLLSAVASAPSPPLASKEAQIVEELWQETTDARTTTGTNLTANEFLELASQSDLIHVSTHCEFDPDDPHASSIVLGSGTGAASKISARSLLYSHSLPFRDVSLIFLNGCSSLAGKQSRSGLAGLGWSLLTAGTRGVIATDYPVLDGLAREVANQFYSLLPRDSGHPRPIHRILRKAVEEAGNKNPAWQDDRFLAPWLFYGDPLCLMDSG